MSIQWKRRKESSVRGGNGILWSSLFTFSFSLQTTFYIIISRFASDFIRFIVTSIVELLILGQEKLYYAIRVTNNGGRVRAQ